MTITHCGQNEIKGGWWWWWWMIGKTENREKSEAPLIYRYIDRFATKQQKDYKPTKPTKMTRC